MKSYHGAVQSPEDALILLEAARLNLIPRVNRRLRYDERLSIRAGDVFVWIESEARMRRWTDGRSWSASRVTGGFLTYREMESSSSRAPSSSHSESETQSNDFDGKYLPSFELKLNGLIKQSFSLTTLHGEKMHLISYTTTSTFSRAKCLDKTPSTDPMFAQVVVPPDIYPCNMPQRQASRSSSPSSPATSPLHSSSTEQAADYNMINSAVVNSASILSSSSNSTSTPYNPRGSSPRTLAPLAAVDQPVLQVQRRLDYDGAALNALDKLSFMN